MFISGIIVVFISQAFLHFVDSCDDIMCSNVYDPVCGEATALDGRKVTQRVQNICYLRLLQCKFRFTGIEQIPDEYCDIWKEEVSLKTGRRLHDFSIVGAQQTCNHTCPTYCRDTYDPVCAQIWSSDSTSSMRMMVNHCHVDMYSCVSGLNVTIQKTDSCFRNTEAMNFIKTVATMNTLKLLGDHHPQPNPQARGRRAYSYNTDVNQLVKKEIKHFVMKLTSKIKELN